MEPIIVASRNSIKTIHPPLGCYLLVCEELSYLFETVSSDGLNFNRLHPSALPLSLRFENYGKYLILSIALLRQIGKKCSPFLLSC